MMKKNKLEHVSCEVEENLWRAAIINGVSKAEYMKTNVHKAEN